MVVVGLARQARLLGIRADLVLGSRLRRGRGRSDRGGGRGLLERPNGATRPDQQCDDRRQDDDGDKDEADQGGVHAVVTSGTSSFRVGTFCDTTCEEPPGFIVTP